MQAIETRRGLGSKGAKSAPDRDSEHSIESITPTPSFVVKTKTFSEYLGSPPGSKLFINVCTSDVVPLPTSPDGGGNTEQFEPQLIYPLIADGQWEIPILTSPEVRDGHDKKGAHCLIVDCLINEKPMRWCMANKELKSILIEWCFDAVEFRVGGGFVINRDVVALPKRSYMGPLTEMQVDMSAIKNDEQDIKELQETYIKGADDPLSILHAKQIDEDEDELHTLTPAVEPRAAPKLLIEEIKEMQIGSPPEERAKNLNVSPAASKDASKVAFTSTFKRLSPPVESYRYLLTVTSELKSGADYRLQYDRAEKELVISARSVSSQKVQLALPRDAGDQFAVYYLKPERAVYIFVK